MNIAPAFVACCALVFSGALLRKAFIEDDGFGAALAALLAVVCVGFILACLV